MPRIPKKVTEAEDAEITRAAESDPDALPLTDEELAELRPASEMLPKIFGAELAASLMRRSPRPARPVGYREVYAARRASLAVDRLIRAKSEDELVKATRWAELWGKVAHWPAALRRNKPDWGRR